ncbi:MAG TPA: molybdate ABC transporter substrate-binding protein [Vicinamibacterales bacterium]|nr:molybdate ABC transporter substrate-binding protein [Vicinamibacterales bacterium]
MRTTLLAAGLVLFLASQDAPEPAAVTVSAAVSLTDALSAIAKEYAAGTRGGVRFNFGASNVLARQIVQGAPVDLFISADAAQMEVVRGAGLIQEGTRVDLVGNQLAVVVPTDRPRTFTSIAQIGEPSFRRIAIGDPAAVPAGVYARQYLEKEGLWAALQPRIVPTGSVRAALAAVEAGAADAAIVYRTDARGALRATVAWVVPLDRGPRIVYPAAIVRGSRNAQAASRFLEFLRSATAERTFTRFGFTARPAG